MLCYKCEEERPLDYFLPQRKQCKLCTYKKHKEWIANNREYYKRGCRKQNYRIFYGVELETVEEMVAKQNSLCYICKKKTKLELDHCHKTKKIRRMLCGKCNKGLGQFDENPELLLAAVAYLKETTP